MGVIMVYKPTYNWGAHPVGSQNELISFWWQKLVYSFCLCNEAWFLFFDLRGGPTAADNPQQKAASHAKANVLHVFYILRHAFWILILFFTCLVHLCFISSGRHGCDSSAHAADSGQQARDAGCTQWDVARRRLRQVTQMTSGIARVGVHPHLLGLNHH
jgi:hypothetical protein